MKYKIIPLDNGSFTVNFFNKDRVSKPVFLNILNYVFLLIDENNGPIIVDAGFDINYIPGIGSTYKRDKHQHISESLQKAGYAMEDIETVIMTHIHWDHTGAMQQFPNAEFTVQKKEFEFFQHFNPNEEVYYCPRHWLTLLDRISLIDGHITLRPGIELLLTGYHTPGHQVVRVNTPSGPVLLAGDSPLLYDTFWKMIPQVNWDILRRDFKNKFYWRPDTFARVKNWLETSPCQTGIFEPIIDVEKLNILADRVFYTHDPGLRGISIIE